MNLRHRRSDEDMSLRMLRSCAPSDTFLLAAKTLFDGIAVSISSLVYFVHILIVVLSSVGNC